MFAVIHSGGKQYRVTEGQTLKLEKLAGESGQAIEFDKILMIADGDNTQVGSPYISGVKINAEVVGHGRAKKIRIVKFRRRKHHMKQQGHRQSYTEVKIIDINTGKNASKKAAAATETPVADAKPAAKKPRSKTATEE